MKKYHEFINEQFHPDDPYGEDDWEDENLDLTEAQAIGRDYRQRFHGYGNWDATFFKLYPSSKVLVKEIIQLFRQLWNQTGEGIMVDELDDQKIPKAILDSGAGSTLLEELLQIRILGHIDDEFGKIIGSMVYTIMETDWNNTTRFYENHLLTPLFMSMEDLFGF